MGDDHRDRQLDPLAAVHRARVGEPQLVGLLGRETEHRVVGGEDERRVVVGVVIAAGAAARRPRGLVQEPQHGSVHQSQLVQVAPGHHQLVADPQPPTAHRLAVGVQRGAQRAVDRVDPQLASVDRREHLDVADRVDVVVAGQPLGDERHDLGQRVARRPSLDQEQIAPHPLDVGEVRLEAASDGVRSLDDHRVGRLAEDVRQPGGGHEL